MVPLKKFTSCLILVTIINIVTAQIPQRLTSPNPCSSKPNCHECIQTPSCAWCYDPNFNLTRCFLPSLSYQQDKQCPEEFVLNPDTVYSRIKDLELTKAHSISGEGGGHLVGGFEGSYNHSESWSASGSEWEQWSGSGGAAGGAAGGQQIVQVKPQRVNLKLRARQSYSIYMNYTQAEDYPVDLYYLMDLSKSMADDKEKLSYLGNQLAATMKRLTSNFRLGFGSFVDKVVMPYVSTLPEKLQHPCDICVAPYGFRHHMTLSTNTNRFSQMVKEANVSGNLDAPEGGFDAIMQAVVCRNQIGWREARRLLVFSTDASFHYAGDGKLGGIVKPNDGSCHLSTDGYYTESSYQDYPSIEQINLSVKQNAINVIFAVTKSTIDIYKQLAKNIEGASVGELEGDSSNIVSLIKEQYEQISSKVEMVHNASSDYLNIKFFTRCLNSTGALVNTNKCANIKVGDIINFKVDIEVKKCPKNRADHFQTIQIYPIGINESLIIDLEMLCECNCEKPGDKYYQEFSPYCHHHGTYKCGICECLPGTFGRFCQCDSDKYNATTVNCINPKGSPDVECSGKGQCICGHCECESRQNENETIYGEYCECDNFSCERHDGKLCSGSDHGECDCGVCRCKEEWTGANCACKKSNETCILPGDITGKICSGHGTCECGVCRCESSTDGKYSGKFCEKCPTCSDKCEEFKNCVQCQQYKTGPLSKNPDDCANNCKTFTPIPVKEVEANEENNEILCTYYDEEDCRFSYVYYYDNENKIQVRVQEERNCPIKVYVLGIVLGVIAAIVLIGMAILLLWKLLTTIHDRREFARFEKEKMMAKWDTGENPIYKQATSTFKNPTYAGKG